MGVWTERGERAGYKDRVCEDILWWRKRRTLEEEEDNDDGEERGVIMREEGTEGT